MKVVDGLWLGGGCGLRFFAKTEPVWGPFEIIIFLSGGLEGSFDTSNCVTKIGHFDILIMLRRAGGL